jgi:hypothetical protein
MSHRSRPAGDDRTSTPPSGGERPPSRDRS